MKIIGLHWLLVRVRIHSAIYLIESIAICLASLVLKCAVC